LPDVSLGPVLLVASASIFGPLSGWLAGQRRRNVAIWALFGVTLGPIAAALLLGAPPGRCAACDRPVGGWRDRCASCGASVRTGLAPAPGIDHPIPSIPPPAAQAAGPVVRTSARRRRTEAMAAATPPIGMAVSAETNGHDDPAWAPRVPATRLGHRPDGGAPTNPGLPEAGDAAGTPLAVLGSGVYIGGNRSIQPGNRYLLARVADELQILGPVHLDPGAVADRVPLGTIEAFRIEDRLVIGGRDGTSDVSMAFVAVSEGRGIDITVELAPPESAASKT
jgi:hypothetical protein